MVKFIFILIFCLVTPLLALEEDGPDSMDFVTGVGFVADGKNVNQIGQVKTSSGQVNGKPAILFENLDKKNPKSAVLIAAGRNTDFSYAESRCDKMSSAFSWRLPTVDEHMKMIAFGASVTNPGGIIKMVDDPNLHSVFDKPYRFYPMWVQEPKNWQQAEEERYPFQNNDYINLGFVNGFQPAITKIYSQVARVQIQLTKIDNGKTQSTERALKNLGYDDRSPLLIFRSPLLTELWAYRARLYSFIEFFKDAQGNQNVPTYCITGDL